MRYRRDRTSGATYFFTVVTWQRKTWFADVDNVARLRAALREVRARHPFLIDAMVVLPDHLHCLWTLPPDDDNYPMRWNRVKGVFTRSLPEVGTRGSSSHEKPERRERAVWQRRYWEHRVRDDDDFARHCDYIHWNPVKHGLVQRAADWPHSSFSRFVAAGIYPQDWGIADNGLLDFPSGE
jgi:putative transposase